jgi:hypothetical protein
LEREHHEKVAWAWRDFLQERRISHRLREAVETLQLSGCLEHLYTEIVFDIGYELPSDPEAFKELRDALPGRLTDAGPKAASIIEAFIPEYEACLRIMEKLKLSRSSSPLQTQRLSDIKGLLDGYAGMLANPYGKIESMQRLPRYMRGCFYRMQMAAEKPKHYDECNQSIEEFRTTARTIRRLHEANLPDVARSLHEFEDMIEEYALALFGHGQIGTRFPVSEQRLRKKMEALSALTKDSQPPQ